jgi:hypothetical protein
MCSYCGCRDIPMISTLNAEHDQLDNEPESIIAGDGQSTDYQHREITVVP